MIDWLILIMLVKLRDSFTAQRVETEDEELERIMEPAAGLRPEESERHLTLVK